MAENSTLTEYHLPKRKLVYGLSFASATMALAPLVLDISFSGKYTGESGSWVVVTVLFGFFAVWAFCGVTVQNCSNLLKH